MKLSYRLLKETASRFGDAFYILDSEKFRRNFSELKAAFSRIYPKTNIAYSYKTNYIPRLCRIVDELGGYAEVVSDMEYELALRVGVSPEKIFFNGPFKNYAAAERLLLDGGTVNIDNLSELKFIRNIILRHPDKKIHIGIRCNFPVGDGVLSRFGFDVDGEDFKTAVAFVKNEENIVFAGLHCHFAARGLDFWKPRAEGAADLYDRLGEDVGYIDLGGGLFGKMGESLKAQFSSYIPNYDEYAAVAATVFAKKFGNDKNAPTLFLEPGSALSGDVMSFAAPVFAVKNIAGKDIAVLLGSMYNINPTLNGKNPPLTVYPCGAETKEYKDLDFGGYTCIEKDYLYKGYNGKLAVGDYVVFDNVGSYSVVLKPPFILPNFAVVDLDEPPERQTVKERETFDDIFHTYRFD